MKKFFRYSIVILALVISSGCATAQNAPQLTPTERTQHNLMPVIDGIGALQLAAQKAVVTIKTDGKPIIPLAAARIIVTFTVGANETIGQFPNGWCPTVRSAYDAMRRQLVPDDRTAMATYFSVFEGVLVTAGCQ